MTIDLLAALVVPIVAIILWSTATTSVHDSRGRWRLRQLCYVGLVAACLLSGCGGSDGRDGSDGDNTERRQPTALSAQQVYDEFSPSCQASVDQLTSTGRGFEDAVEEISKDSFGDITGIRSDCRNPYRRRQSTPSESDEAGTRKAPETSSPEYPCGAVIGEGTPREITTSGLPCSAAKRLALKATLVPERGGCAVSGGSRVVLREPCALGAFDCRTIGAYQTDYSRGECTDARGQRISFVFG